MYVVVVLAWLYAHTTNLIDLFAFFIALTMLWLPTRLIDHHPITRIVTVVVTLAAIATITIGLGLALGVDQHRPRDLVTIVLGIGIGIGVLVGLVHLRRRGVGAPSQ